MAICKSELAKRPLLYTDTIGGEQVCRDDMWAVTTEELNAVAPNWKGYALLGTGRYLINHSADFDPDLGAELVITLATDADRSGGRQVGESRLTPAGAAPIQPEDMVIRIGFLTERALFALEDQLSEIRKQHFSDEVSPTSPPSK